MAIDADPVAEADKLDVALRLVVAAAGQRHVRKAGDVPTSARVGWLSTARGTPASTQPWERVFWSGEKDSSATTDLPITMQLTEPPEPCDLLRGA